MQDLQWYLVRIRRVIFRSKKIIISMHDFTDQQNFLKPCSNHAIIPGFVFKTTSQIYSTYMQGILQWNYNYSQKFAEIYQVVV